MLRELYIRNLAIVEEASVEFGKGLNVLTGETGAGKSIVVDALGLLGGARATSDLIRSGAEVLTITGRFQPAGIAWRKLLDESGFDPEDDELVVRREVSRSGRNRVYIDDQPATLRLLQALAPFLLRIHTQREELGLVSNELQRDWLDQSAGAAGGDARSRVARRFENLEAARAKWERLTGDDKLRLERMDLLKFQVSEINAAGVNDGEESELRRDRDLLRNAEAIAGALGLAMTLLNDGDESAADQLGRSRRALEEIAGWLPEADGWNDRLGEASASLEDVVTGLRSRLSAADVDPARLNEIEDRLATLERLFRKYGTSSHEVLTYRAQIEDELRELGGDESDRAQLEARLTEAVAEYRQAAIELTRARRSWGIALAEKIHLELADLAMGKAEFSVELEHRKRQDAMVEIDGVGVESSSDGVDKVVFHLRANPGEAAGPVAKVASGGELARLYLALQLAVHAANARIGANAGSPVLVFDEVDAGIGGAEAAALGRKLQRLAQGGQILAVTHLPQVASFAGGHFQVKKRTGKDRTRIAVERLSEGERVDEIARMLAGEEVTDLSRSHARELISEAG